MLADAQAKKCKHFSARIVLQTDEEKCAHFPTAAALRARMLPKRHAPPNSTVSQPEAMTLQAISDNFATFSAAPSAAAFTPRDRRRFETN